MTIESKFTVTRRTVAGLALSLCALPSYAALATGDLAFTALNADEDGWALVALTDIDPSTTIFFQDNEWNGASFNIGESSFSWDTGAAPIAAGTVIRFSAVDSAARAASFGTFSAVDTSNLGLSATAETVYAFLGTSATTPTAFLTAVTTDTTTLDATNAGLTPGLNAIALTTSTDFAQYTGDRASQATFAGYRPLVNNPANWNIIVGGDNATAIPNTTAFTVTPIPVPAALPLLISGLAGLGVLRRRRSTQ